MHRIKFLLVAALAFGTISTGTVLAKPHAARKRVKRRPPPKKKIVRVSAAKKKVLAELLGGFKFGMTKNQVLKVLAKQVDQRYDEKIRATEDISRKDHLRQEKRVELARVKKSYIEFKGRQANGWDVSIIEGEFAHDTNESMLDRWENKDGKNQRRFFFFYQGKLWKMALSIDVSILPVDKRNFETFKAVMEGKYGPGAVEPGKITWTADNFEVRALDKLRTYTALILAIEDPNVRHQVLALRAERAPKKKGTSPIIKAVVETDDSTQMDVKQNSNAVDSVINATGGGGRHK